MSSPRHHRRRRSVNYPRFLEDRPKSLPERFARPDFFEEGDPRILARARPGMASGGIKNGRNLRK